MARSYKSALPTWSTFTPHVGPLGVQAPINQETIWRNRARQYTPGGIAGEVNRANMGLAAMVKGTGAGPAAAQARQHTPIINAIQGLSDRRRAEQRDWARKTQEALELQTPEALTEPGEAQPLTDMQRRAARTAPPTVNPTNVATQDAARQTVAVAADAAMSSPKVGTASTGGPAPAIGVRPVVPTFKINDRRAR